MRDHWTPPRHLRTTLAQLPAAEAKRAQEHFYYLYGQFGAEPLNYPWGVTDIPRLEFNPASEYLVRDTIMTVWREYFAARRQRTLAAVAAGDKNAEELQRSKFYRLTEPEGLSGACKIAAQVSYLVFPFQGWINSNQQHTFIVTKSGDIYDMNRHCGDVSRLLQKGKYPYRIGKAETYSPAGVRGLMSWDKVIWQVIDLLRQSQFAVAPMWQQRHLTRVPQWAQSIHLRRSDREEDAENLVDAYEAVA